MRDANNIDTDTEPPVFDYTCYHKSTYLYANKPLFRIHIQIHIQNVMAATFCIVQNAVFQSGDDWYIVKKLT